ncbi:hypothetical protein N0V84_011417 [Fusarium piperis]|uniref:Heme peroxidase n=1 Tax=Fusarium piperis TaxID=1435070 RepID=A0A9W8TB82_9HYPO|nr:hypothetical protein N0V84_011417 [Fusarium piperis]
MSMDSQRPLQNGHARSESDKADQITKLNEQLTNAMYLSGFHGDTLIGDKQKLSVGILNDIKRIFTFDNAPDIIDIIVKLLTGRRVDMKTGAKLVASMSNDSRLRGKLIEGSVKTKYERMLHPPLTYLGSAFKYRTADGKFNSALNPQLGQAGAPYAKTVPSKTHPLGALPDPADLFDRLMARDEGGRNSGSGLSSMLIYHATIIIHDIFRTNDSDKNISDTSSYLDLSPLYGFTDEMQRKVRDDKYKLGLLKPDTFAEDRLLRQPPGVCIYLVMYNRYHNYVATQLRRINENGRFSVPHKFEAAPLAGCAKEYATGENAPTNAELSKYTEAWKKQKSFDPEEENKGKEEFDKLTKSLRDKLDATQGVAKAEQLLEAWTKAHTDAWNKLDDDLFHTSRLITCGMYIQISIHDYLRALMGFHNFDTNFTLDPRLDMKDHKNVSRGLGNQVTVEFNLLYRFHCAISLKDEKYAEDFMQQYFGKDSSWNAKDLSLKEFMEEMGKARRRDVDIPPKQPWEETFGLPLTPELCFERNKITGLFNDQQMVDELTKAMDDPISNFGPRNVPKCLKAVEILGILQARKWEIGTLNDFRDFFGMERHKTFESITPHKEVQEALRDLYDHPDKVELYPGVFCESDVNMGADPGPSDVDSALWAAIFSDAITLVRSDRFYTVWYPYNSIRFFHPFYTAQKNAELAKQQGFADGFDMQVKTKKKNWLGKPIEFEYDTSDSNPRRPSKPVYLFKKSEIKQILEDRSDNIVHPARLRLKDFPDEIAAVLKPGQGASDDGPASTNNATPSDHEAIVMYLVDLMRDIIKREFIIMDKNKGVYQLDVVRDFAIPVVTRYVSDFLGFGHLVRSDKNDKAPYSENEIYQHITNCQVFLSYNSDETKLLRRRKAFKDSMTFLLNLTKQGNICNAARWAPTHWIRNGLEFIASCGKIGSNPMVALGFKVAQEVLKNEKDTGRAAAILLLTGLDSAYNTVLAFTSVMDTFLRELYDGKPKPGSGAKQPRCDWLDIQDVAFDDSKEAHDFVKKVVLKVQKASVKLPIIRKATKPFTYTGADTKQMTIPEGSTVLCDINRAEKADKSGGNEETNYLSYCSSFSEAFYIKYHPKHVAALSLVTMVKVLAQLKNLRRGHDTQGMNKKINIDASAEGYSNYMAPMRMTEIQMKVAALKDDASEEEKKELSRLFNERPMRPAVCTYLTAEWDEMLPFPTTWKLRFNGYGVSDYSKDDFAVLRVYKLRDDIQPMYQPKGPSDVGGSFATPVCICEIAGKQYHCNEKDGKDGEDHKDEDCKKIDPSAPPCDHLNIHQPATSGCKLA